MERIAELKWQWVGHVLRLEQSKWTSRKKKVSDGIRRDSVEKYEKGLNPGVDGK